MKINLSQTSERLLCHFVLLAFALLTAANLSAIPTTASGIEFDATLNRFRVTCAEGSSVVPCSDLDLSPYQFFWRFGDCGYSFEAEPSYTFREGEPQDVSVSLKRINIYDEEYGPSKLGFSRNFTGMNTELPPPDVTNGLLELDLTASGSIRGLFQSVIVIEYENRTQFNLSNAEIEVEISQMLNEDVTVQTCCDGVAYARTKSGGKDRLLFTLDEVEVNERCKIYLIYDVDPIFRTKAGEAVDVKVNSFINYSQDDKQGLRANLNNPKAGSSSRISSDAASISLRVTEPFDPNSKVASPAGCIGEKQEITYTISFLNEGTASTNIIDIFDTIATSLDLSTLTFQSLTVLGIDQNINAPFIKMDITGNVVHWEFPAVLPPDPDSDAAQGYLTFRIFPKADLAENSIIGNRASIIFDKGAQILTNTMMHKVNCPDQISMKNKNRMLTNIFLMLGVVIILLVIILFLQLIILSKS